MKTNFLRLKPKHTWTGAAAFYILWLILSLLISIAAGIVVGLLLGPDAIRGAQVIAYAGVVGCLSFAILKEKGLQRKWVYILTGLCAVAIVFFTPAMISLLLVASLTMVTPELTTPGEV